LLVLIEEAHRLNIRGITIVFPQILNIYTCQRCQTAPKASKSSDPTTQTADIC